MLGKTHVVTTGALMTGTMCVSYIIDHSVGLSSSFVGTINNVFTTYLGIDWAIEREVSSGFSFDVLQLGLVSHLIILLLLTLLGSLLPDIDTPTSTLGRFVPFIGAIIPHRTITHTIWIVLVMGIAIFIFGGNAYFIALWIGYILHIIEDTFSRQGIAWFYPIDGYRTYGSGAVVKRGRDPKFFYYRTGSDTETGIFYVALVFWLIFTVYLSYLIYFK